MTNQYALPRDVCEWCGAEFIWVRVLPLQANLSVRIDVDPVDFMDPAAKYGRVNPATVEGKIDCVTKLNEGNRHRFKRGWTAHSETCSEKEKWAGRKKWRSAVITRKDLDELLAVASPELDRLPDPSGQIHHLP